MGIPREARSVDEPHQGICAGISGGLLVVKRMPLVETLRTASGRPANSTVECVLSSAPTAHPAATAPLQTIEHLRQAFPETACPIAHFQMHFQTDFF